MAFRTWGRMLLAAVGVAAFAGAVQLGFAYGLGVVRFGRVFDASAEGLWAAQITWGAWFAIVAAVAGATAVGSLATRRGLGLTGMAPRVAIAGAAGVGALAVAPLTMLPAQSAVLTSIDPVLTAGLCALLGALIGMAAALATLSHRPFAWNVAFVVAAVWLVALLSVGPSLSPADPLPDVRLGVVDPASLSASAANRLAVLTMPALALLAGLASGLLARSGRYPTVVAAGCGAIGPALLALAYLAAGPGGGDSYQAAPYWGAVIATGAGTLGSVVATAVRLPAAPVFDAPTEPVPDDARPGPAAAARTPSEPGDGERAAPATRTEPTETPQSPVPAGTATAGIGTTGSNTTDIGSNTADAGSNTADAGTSTADAGTSTADGGSNTADGGSNTADGGTSTADASTAGPSQSSESAAGGGRPTWDRPRRSRGRAQTRDEEYVNWVSGLGGPGEPAVDEPDTRRTLRRPTGIEPD